METAVLHDQARTVGGDRDTSIQQSLRLCVECIYDIYELFGYKEEGKRASVVEKTLGHWLSICMEHFQGDWMKTAKWKLAAFKSYWLGCTIPPSGSIIIDNSESEPKYLLCGGPSRFQFAILTDYKRRWAFIQSLSQAKKGMPRPDKVKLEKAEKDFEDLFNMEKPIATMEEYEEVLADRDEKNKDTREELVYALTGRKVYNAQFKDKDWAEESFHDDTIIPQELSQSTVKEQLRRTVREVFTRRRKVEYKDAKGKTRYEYQEENIPMKIRELVKAFFPSTSANYIASRNKGGAIQVILEEHPDLLSGLRVPGGHLKVDTVKDQEERIGKEHSYVQADPTELEENFSKFYWRAVKKCMQEELPLVSPVALAEALKVRTISKGPPLLMTVLRPVWKFIHNRMRRHPAFKLIGAGMEEWDEIVLNRMGASLGEDETYISGDYKAATDNLKSWVSETIAEELADCLEIGEELKKLLMTGLTRHVMEKDSKLYLQIKGQLMGSIVSFPVLCLANAAMCRWSHELVTGRKWTLKDCPIAVNGDDVVIKSKFDFYKVWQRTTGYIGLEESLGKTYVSRDFLEINSTLYRRDEKDLADIICKDIRKDEEHEVRENESYEEYYRRVESGDKTVLRKTPFHRAKYVNMGLVMGLKRSGTDTGIVDPIKETTLSSLAHQLKFHCPEDMFSDVMRLFVKKNEGILKDPKLRNIPWYAPLWLGGIGLPEWEDGYLSEVDRRVATAIIMNMKDQRKRPIPINKLDTLWKVRNVAADKIPAANTSSRKDITTEHYESIVGMKCVDLLFDSTISLKELAPDLKKDKEELENRKVHKIGKVLKHNSELWNPANYKHLPKPIPLDALKYDGNYSSYNTPNQVTVFDFTSLKEKMEPKTVVLSNDLD